jgi:hypothetical protein
MASGTSVPETFVNSSAGPPDLIARSAISAASSSVETSRRDFFQVPSRLEGGEERRQVAERHRDPSESA